MEIELKFPLLNSEETINKLNSLAKPEKNGILQKDTYYNPPHKNFLDKKPISEWLRLRESKKGNSINYKRWHNDSGNTTSCDEHETLIDNLKEYREILTSLGFKEVIVVEKLRSTWSYKNTEIAIDMINDLGKFIEIEAKGEFKDKKEAEKHLYSVLNELNIEVGSQDFEGYPLLLLKKKGLI